ncbi:MAG TPA: hypothetical protein PLR72_06750 [Paludibacteraceae bacterium]|nr:hypothetical protein [Paludibacteraceae bacterium]
MLNYFPKYFTQKAMLLYVISLAAVTGIFFSHAMSWVWIFFGLVEVIGFFYFSNELTRHWSKTSPKVFTKRLFTNALIIRLVWVVFSYFFYKAMTGQPFEFDAADAAGYHNEASWLADMIHKGNIQPYFAYINGRFSDMGYPFYLGCLYTVTGKSILFARLLKAFYGALTCVLVYKLTARNFEESTGRIAGILAMLMPNLIYYSGVHLKEAEMVFLTVAFIERADALLRNRKFNFINIFVPTLLGASLFFFRTALGMTALFAVLTTLVFAPNKMVRSWKRVIYGIWIGITIIYFAGTSISSEVESLWQNRKENQTISMQWRAERPGGNRFARYASSTVFASLILVIPFPTMVNIEGQENQQTINGGNFVKNILAFFVIFALIWVIKNKVWRKYLLIGSFTIGYLLILAFSGFAHSERFHQPALPFILILAAVGISRVTNRSKKYFWWWMVFVFIAAIGWNWFKLAGRGLV